MVTLKIINLWNIRVITLKIEVAGFFLTSVFIYPAILQHTSYSYIHICKWV